jgi:hypothetical protein
MRGIVGRLPRIGSAARQSVSALSVVGLGPLPYTGATAPSGWIFASGKTIGSGASGATERANADTEPLFTLYWTDYDDTSMPIQTSAGSPSTRGASPAADFAANKRMTVPDARDRVVAGKGNMGDTAADRLTAGVSGIDSAILGAAGGDQRMQTHLHDNGTLAAPAHDHPITPAGTGTGTGIVTDQSDGAGSAKKTGSGGGGALTGAMANAGAGSSQNVQPTIIENMIIKL